MTDGPIDTHTQGWKGKDTPNFRKMNLKGGTDSIFPLTLVVLTVPGYQARRSFKSGGRWKKGGSGKIASGYATANHYENPGMPHLRNVVSYDTISHK